MEEIQNEFILKSGTIKIGTKPYGLFWGVNLAETIKEKGLEVDLKKIAKCDYAETIKLIYCCMLHYNKLAEKLKVSHWKEIPTLEGLATYFEINPQELAKAIEYIVSQIRDNGNKKKEQPQQKKKRIHCLFQWLKSKIGKYS